MFYLIQTDWIWFVVAVLAGAAVGYWATSPQDPLLHEFKGWVRWVAIAFAVGLVVAVLHWLPGRAGLYLETLLGVVFSYVVGSLVGTGLGRAWARVEAATAPGAMQVGEAAVSAAAETRPPGTRAAAAESVCEAVDRKATEESQRAGDAKAAEEARRAEGAAEKARRTAEAKATEEARLAADAKAAEEARRAAEAKAVEVVRRGAQTEEAEVARQVADTKAAEGKRHVADTKATAESRRAGLPKNTRRSAESKAAADARRAAPAKAAEEIRRALDAEAAAEARRAAAEATRRAVHAQAAKEVCRAADAEAAAEARRAADAKGSLGARRLTEPKVRQDAPRPAPGQPIRPAARPPAAEPISATAAGGAPVASTTPSKPVGIDAPLHNKADDLKLIKGIGAKNEKICNDLGIYHFAQIADWSSNEAAWVGQHMAFPGRVEREHWIAQAQLLASGGDTEHSAGVKAGTIALDDGADAPLDEVQAATLRNLLPEKAAAVENETRHLGRRPYGLLVPRGGRADNLKRVRGIGPQSQARLNALGIWHYGQIAAWSAENIKWIGSYLAAAGRIEREKWIDQAKELAAGQDGEVRRGATTGKVSSAKRDGAEGQRRAPVVEPRNEG